MDQQDLHETFLDLSTAHVADAIVRLGSRVRQAPPTVRPLRRDARVLGRARPVRHAGSVDVLLEAIEHAATGDVLVIDNRGRRDEACVGDLLALEARHAGLAGIVIWGLHRDTRELRAIALPLYSEGAVPAGPARLGAQPAVATAVAQIGEAVVTSEDVVFGDDDGVLFLPLGHWREIADAARAIRDTERAQALRMNAGVTLRDQTRFAEFLVARARQGTTFREHLRNVGGAIEQ
ncbi:RraA family protein [Cellulosimicrobium cellulans]|uniref:RraA family protein n=1 Tax=Cellulosimicrobium cellulans TaxID=1710 RepID=UPI001C9E47C5|nr:RraA family protein [Cellulosimicrobium cellulans]